MSRTRIRSSGRGSVWKPTHLPSRGEEDWQKSRGGEARDFMGAMKGKTFSEIFWVGEGDRYPSGEFCSGFLRIVSHCNLIKPSPIGEGVEGEAALACEVHWPWQLSKTPFGGAMKPALSKENDCTLVTYCCFDLLPEVELNGSRRLRRVMLSFLWQDVLKMSCCEDVPNFRRKKDSKVEETKNEGSKGILNSRAAEEWMTLRSAWLRP